ncbi:MAG: methyltransferase domain-containing protein [Lachnospiraceae bacterium]|nr:methyltransferase domain-containing protein [Lachnospiraceae bacterium]
MAKDGYYTSGEFARKANVTLRTIRYYDKQGILKPSRIDENGYRLYTDSDFAKLQKILSLKYLGFSLEEIMTITINDQDQDFMRESIDLQLNLVRKKIDHLNMVEQSLKEASKKLESKQTIDWEEIVQLIHVTNQEHSLVDQYKNASNLDVRIRLHKEYSTNPVRWFPWIFNQMDLKPGYSVLEIGCGTGELWMENLERIPKDVRILLSDQSAGMIQDAKNRLGQTGRRDIFEYQVFDCHQIPFEKESFDLVIANHLLFYISDRKHVLKEVKRVLKPGGIFLCSTYGRNHMKEITQLVQAFDSEITLSERNLYEEFGLENGGGELSSIFSKVEERCYEDSLFVDRAEPIVDYILSCHGNQHEHLSRRYLEFKEFVRQRLENGAFKITKMAGIFICSK